MGEPDWSLIVGRNVCELRRRRGWSQVELANAMSVHLGGTWSRQAMSAAEKGRRSWTANELAAAVSALAVELGDLFNPDVVTLCPTCGQPYPEVSGDA